MACSKMYLTGQEAVDVNRFTGIPLSYRQRLGHQPDTHYEAVDQGVVSINEVYYELASLSWWDAWRIMWTRIGGHFYCDTNGWK